MTRRFFDLSLNDSLHLVDELATLPTIRPSSHQESFPQKLWTKSRCRPFPFQCSRIHHVHRTQTCANGGIFILEKRARRRISFLSNTPRHVPITHCQRIITIIQLSCVMLDSFLLSGMKRCENFRGPPMFVYITDSLVRVTVSFNTWAFDLFPSFPST